MSAQDCPFCQLGSRITGENELAWAVPDQNPATKGHTLVIPKRHCESFFDLSAEEVAACYALLSEARTKILTEHEPAGFNVGVNDGAAAGQTVEHCHLHLLPRYEGDHPDPRGGVRHVLPTRR